MTDDLQTIGSDAATVADRAKFAPDLSELSRYGRYVVEEELGRGGMGIVYAAVDPSLGRRVAVKVVLGVSGDDAVSRLTREAQAVAQLSHPNVVSVFDFGDERGLPYIVMEFVDGEPLSAWLAARPPWRKVVRVYAEAAKGLAAAHAAGLVHRDFKPANVLIGPGRVVKVVDFGLARPPSRDSTTSTPRMWGSANLATLTETGVAMGTPPYMAPEQHRGEQVGPASDIYAFGVALYRGLFGELPFKSRDMVALITAKNAGIPEEPPPSMVPAELYALLRTLLEPTAQRRCSDLGAVARQLHKLAKRRARRSRWAIAAVAAGTIALSLSGPSDPAELAPPTAAAAGVDEQLEAEAERLADEVAVLYGDGAVQDGLGLAYHAHFVAVSSGSEELRARTLGLVARGWAGLKVDGVVDAQLQEAIDALVAVGNGRDALWTCSARAMSYSRRDMPREFRDTVRECEALAVRFDLERQPELAVKLLALRAIALGRDRVDDALPIWKEAVEVARKNPEDVKAVTLGNMLRNLAIWESRRDPVAAYEHAVEAKSVFAEARGEDDGLVVGMHSVLAQIEMARGRYESCLEHAAAAAQAKSASVGVRRTAALFASACAVRGPTPELAIVWLERAEAIAGEAGEIDEDTQLTFAIERANALGVLGRADEADKSLLRAVVLAESLGDQDSQVRAWLNLAKDGEATELTPRRREYLAKAFALTESDRVAPSVRLDARVRWAAALEKDGEAEPARAALELDPALALGTTARDVANRAYVKAIGARLDWKAGDRKQAVALMRQALAELPDDTEADGKRESFARWLREHENLVQSD